MFLLLHNNKIMKILHIHTSLQVGGIEALIADLSNEMSKKHDVTVCTIFEPSNEDVFFRRLSEKIKKISCHKIEKGFSLKEILSIYRVIKNGDYDIIHMHGFMHYYIFSIICMLKKTNFIYTVHNDAEKENCKWDKRLFLLKKMIFKSKLVFPVTISEASQSSFEKLYHVDNKMIYNGVSRVVDSGKKESLISSLRITNDTLVFFHAGRIVEQKNQLVLCKVFKKLIEEGYDVTLIIAGDVHNVKTFRKIEPYFSDRIVYVGKRDDVIELIKESDAFCLSSIFEGMPISLIESFSVGCIPICSPVGGIVNMIIDNENGFLSRSPYEDDYYDCVKRFINSEENQLRNIRIRAKKAFAEKYDIRISSKEYLNLYTEIIKKGYCKLGK